MTKRKAYNEDSIKVLSPIAAIRSKASMYIGETSSNGVFHILKEVADNAIDEALAKRNDSVFVAIDKAGYVWVGDNGNGIPTGKHKQTGLSTIETILTVTHAGGKFDDKAYEAAVGTHGLGVTVTNALSAEFDAWSNYTGSWQHIAFNNGIKVQELHKQTPPSFPGKFKPTGTIIRFKPDYGIFDKGAKLHESEVLNWCEMSAYMNANVRIAFVDSKNTVKEWRFKRGIEDYVDKLNGKSDERKRLVAQSPQFDLAVSYLDEGSLEDCYFTNTSVNRHGGTHERAVWKAMHDALWEFTKRNHEFEIPDIKHSLTLVMNIKLNQPKFQGQTKERLVDERGTKLYEALFDEFHAFFYKHKTLTQTLLEEATDRYAERSATVTDKKLARELKKEHGKGNILPGARYVMAPRCKPEERELFLVEGDSAYGSICSARHNIHTQEILALKGKPINASRVEVARYSANQEVFNILVAMGYAPDAKDPYKELRVQGKVIFLADADDDGFHVNLLLMVLFARVLPKLFEQGKVYIADAPLFNCDYKGQKYYGNTKAELLAQLPKTAKPDIQRLKGWGEASQEQMRHIAMDPETRKLIRVTTKTVKEIHDFLDFMGHNGGDERKELLGIEVGV